MSNDDSNSDTYTENFKFRDELRFAKKQYDRATCEKMEKLFMSLTDHILDDWKNKARSVARDKGRESMEVFSYKSLDKWEGAPVDDVLHGRLGCVGALSRIEKIISPMKVTSRRVCSDVSACPTILSLDWTDHDPEASP